MSTRKAFPNGKSPVLLRHQSHYFIYTPRKRGGEKKIPWTVCTRPSNEAVVFCQSKNTPVRCSTGLTRHRTERTAVFYQTFSHRIFPHRRHEPVRGPPHHSPVSPPRQYDRQVVLYQIFMSPGGNGIVVCGLAVPFYFVFGTEFNMFY